jgi:hypothetical protein
LGAPFAFGEEDFYEIKGREIPSKSHNVLNTTDNNTGLPECFFASVELWNARGN